MKRNTLCTLILFCSLALSAQEKKDIIKTGLNFGPLPAVGYDEDKGFQYGAILQIFDYGDGTSYPNYESKTHIEYSRFTKGSQLIQVRHDNKTLIPGLRWSTMLRAEIDKAYDFYGLNGYASNYGWERIAEGKSGENFRFNPFYRMQRNHFTFRSDFKGTITGNFQWEAALFAKYMKIGTINYDNINKGKDESTVFPADIPTLYDLYVESGTLNEKEADGGFSSGIRLGLAYDSRDKEGAPGSGIWAEAHVTAAPGFLSEEPYYRYSFTWRHYVPVIRNDVLTFAYRLNYEGNFGSYCPFYILPFLTAMGESIDRDGMGGYGTVRGIMRARIVGLDMATYSAEFRWRFTRFRLRKQNIALALNLFSDGAMVTRGCDLSPLRSVESPPVGILGDRTKDSLHASFGAGFRFIMNENFIVGVEYGTPLTRFMKNSPLYNQDGSGSTYVNLGYCF
ncbi:MAG: BamA/TamA family outer membrane protein [Bacteroidales bacterium]|nr:BamA/TamA family outer membrane protein [Bacteroidales bacterium]